MKTKKLLAKISLLLCVVMLAPMLFACGEGSTDATTTEGGAATEAPVADVTTEAPTPEPTTPEPTEPPTTYEPIDPSLPYYEQMAIEFERFGFHDGVDVLMAENEADTMTKFSNGGPVKKEVYEVSGEDVPFTVALKVDVTDTPENFWEASINRGFLADVPLEMGDIIAGVFWVKEGGGENEATFHLGIKTPTDNWASEGALNISSDTTIMGEGWRKVYFYGEVLNEEPQSSVMSWNWYLGFGLQKLEIGGFYCKKFSADQFKATLNMPESDI